jgi:hypothetical protein
VEVNVHRQVEADLGGSTDWSRDLYSGHGRSVRLSWSGVDVDRPLIRFGVTS